MTIQILYSMDDNCELEHMGFFHSKEDAINFLENEIESQPIVLETRCSYCFRQCRGYYEAPCPFFVEEDDFK